MEEKRAYYAIIPANIRYDKDLKANAKLLYGEITALCNEKGYCWAKNAYFAELYGVSKGTISVWINQLIKKGYLFSEIKYKNGTKEVEDRYLKLNEVPIVKNNSTPVTKNNDTPIVKNDDTYNEKTGEALIKNDDTPITKNRKDNNTIYNNTINNTLDNNTISKDIVCSTEVQQIVNAWNSLKLQKIFSVNSGTIRYKLLKARIKEYGIDNILKAISNINSSAFLKGQNKNNWIITFDWFIRPNNFIKVLEDNFKNRSNCNYAQSENKNINHSGFNNFKPREYDYDSLEEKLLGWQ